MIFRRGLAALFVLLAVALPARAQMAGWVWEFPATTSYTAGTSDNGKALSPQNVPNGAAAITVTLPSPGAVSSSWTMGFGTDNGRGIIVNAPVGVYILAGQKTLTSFTLPSNDNFEFAALGSDGINFRLISMTRGSSILNGLTGVAGGENWAFLYSSGYSATVQDNGKVLSSSLTGGAMTITLPPTSLLPTGWTVGLYADTGNPITLQVNGVSGGSILTLEGRSVSSYGLNSAYGRAELDLQFDGGNFRILRVVDNEGTAILPRFGAVCDGVSDDSAAMQAAANANPGLDIILPAGKICAIAVSVTANANSVGFSCPVDSDAVVGGRGCELKWTGAAGGRMLAFIAPSGSTSNFRLNGNFVKRIRFNGNNGLAKDAIYLAGVYRPVLQRLSFVGGFSGGSIINFDILPVVQGVTFGENQGNQYGESHGIDIYNTGFTSNGIYLGYYQNVGAVPGANASINDFQNLHIFTGSGNNGRGIWCYGCDNNTFRNVYITTTGAPPIDFDIANVNSHLFGANNNIFDHLGFLGGNTISRGTTSVPSCTAFAYPASGTCSWGNELRALDGSNGTVNPVQEPGSFLKWSFDYGLAVNDNNLIAGDGIRAAETLMQTTGATNICGTDSLAFGAGVLSYYCAVDTPAHFFSNGSATGGQQDHFTIGIYGSNGSRNLRWNHPAGTGFYEFADSDVKMNALPASAGAGGLYVCVDNTGFLYKKAQCP